MIPVGTLVNAAAIVVGGLVGLAAHSRFPERVRVIVFQGLGLCTLLLGMKMAFKADDVLVVIFSVLIGGVVGELVDMEARLEGLGNRLKSLVKSKDDRFTDALVTASLLYCIGAMAIVGSLDEGVRGDPTVLLAKSILDGFASVALAATLGVGVVFAALPVLLYQGGITLFASAFQEVFTDELTMQLTATGGLLILGIGINLLELTRIKLSNLLPALPMAVILTLLF